MMRMLHYLVVPKQRNWEGFWSRALSVCINLDVFQVGTQTERVLQAS